LSENFFVVGKTTFGNGRIIIGHRLGLRLSAGIEIAALRWVIIIWTFSIRWRSSCSRLDIIGEWDGPFGRPYPFVISLLKLLENLLLIL